MRVLVISDISGHMRGGVPTETRSLITGLIARGHSVAFGGDVLPPGVPPVPLYVLKLPIDDSFVADVSAALVDFRPDFVHVMCMSSRGVLRLAPLLSRYKWGLTVHSVPPYERKLNRWHGSEALHYGARAMRFALHSFVWRWIFSRGLVPMIVVHSQFVYDIVISYGATPPRVRLIPLPFETSDVGCRNVDAAVRSADPLLVTVAGFAHTKGQHDVVKALPTLIRRFRGIRYQMIGEARDETYVAYLRKLASKLGITAHVLICPDLDQESKEMALMSADIYVQPSHEEGFCLAYAEAAAIVPRLLGSNTGAIAAMSRDDEGARIVPAKSPPSIGRMVVELLDAKLPTDLLRSRAERLVREFSFDRYLEEHEKLYCASGSSN